MKKIICFILSIFILTNCLNLRVKGVSAKAYVLINADTLGVIKAQNHNLKLSMASTTKIMTALILAEQNTPNKKVTVTKEMINVEGSSMGLKTGDVISYNDLLYGLLLASGNDAANVVAISLGGSLEGFAKIMNNKAKELGLKNTNFVTPSGLDDENHYTTAYDLAVLTAHAIKNETFLKAASSYKATLTFGSPPQRRTYTNHNRLLIEYDYAIGVKTGFTKKSGRCLVSAARFDGKTVICVTLNDPDDWDDHKKLLEQGLNSLTSYSPQNINQFSSIDVLNGEKEKVNLNFDYGDIALTEDEKSEITVRIHLQHNVIAPIYKGQIVGKIIYYVKNKPVKTFNITSKENVKSVNINFISKYFCCLKLLLN